MDLMGDNDFTVQSLATLTALAVFKDIIPGYRIRETTEAENSQTKVLFSITFASLLSFFRSALQGRQEAAQV